MFKSIKSFLKKRKEKSIQKAIKTLCNKKTNKDSRYAAIEKLEEEAKTNDVALIGLIKRFNFSVDHSIQDTKEKEVVKSIIIKHVPRSIPLLKNNLLKEFNISWTLQTLKESLSEEEIVQQLLSALIYDDISFSINDIEKNLEILNILRDYKQDYIYNKIKGFLESHDERIRFSTMELLAIQSPERAAKDLAIYINDESMENIRLRRRVLELYKENAWKVPNPQMYKGGKICDGIYINSKGLISIIDQ